MFFFFFKQKTAYEVRISDWSSDVCSSDLARAADRTPPAPRRGRRGLRRGGDLVVHQRGRRGALWRGHLVARQSDQRRSESHAPVAAPRPARRGRAQPESRRGQRSEEHTSELQSLMRISYAGFCLKKKNNKLA